MQHFTEATSQVGIADYSHRITEASGYESTSGDHLVTITVTFFFSYYI